jgi:hypothetical protein
VTQKTRINLFTSMRLAALDPLGVRRSIDEIGRLRVVVTREAAA